MLPFMEQPMLASRVAKPPAFTFHSIHKVLHTHLLHIKGFAWFSFGKPSHRVGTMEKTQNSGALQIVKTAAKQV